MVLMQNFTVGLLKNDIIVTGTDGLWDNMFPQGIAQLATAFHARGRSSADAATGLAEYARRV